MKFLLKVTLSSLLIGLSFTSCKDDEDYRTIESVDKVKIDSVSVVNDTMDVFSVQSIRTFSKYSSGCRGFYGYDYIHRNDLEREVTAYQFLTNQPCTDGTYQQANQINFSPDRKSVV